MASDPLRGRLVLFGEDLATSVPQTWEWDGTVWQAMAPATQPPIRDRGAMAYDPARNRILFTGGISATQVWMTDAWEWDGVAWQQLPAVASRTSALAHQVTTDLGGGRLLFVDSYGRLLTWVGSTWQVIGSIPVPFQSLFESTAAWDEVRGKLLIQLYGWQTHYPPPFYIPVYVWYWLPFEWDGAFHPVSSMPGGAPFFGARPMVFDAERQRVAVLNHRDTISPVAMWEWSGTWSQTGQHPRLLQPLVAYDHVGGATMVYDTERWSAPSQRFFRSASATPATIASQGSGCAGSLGVPVLAAAPYSRPWTGDTFEVRVDNVPAGATPFLVVGFAATNLVLGGLGMPSCQLLATPDILQALQPAPGQRATWSLQVPPLAALAGTTLHFQGALVSAGGAGSLGGAMSHRLTATAGVR